MGGGAGQVQGDAGDAVEAQVDDALGGSGHALQVRPRQAHRARVQRVKGRVGQDLRRNGGAQDEGGDGHEHDRHAQTTDPPAPATEQGGDRDARAQGGGDGAEGREGRGNDGQVRPQEPEAGQCQADEHERSIVEGALKKVFAPEFLNRIDDIVMFNALDKENIKGIVEVELEKLLERMKGLGYSLRLTEKAKEFIAEKGYDKQYGARPLKRTIQRYIEDEIAEKIVLSEVRKGDTISVDYMDHEEKLTFLVSNIKNIPVED